MNEAFSFYGDSLRSGDVVGERRVLSGVLALKMAF